MSWVESLLVEAPRVAAGVLVALVALVLLAVLVEAVRRAGRTDGVREALEIATVAVEEIEAEPRPREQGAIHYAYVTREHRERVRGAAIVRSRIAGLLS